MAGNRLSELIDDRPEEGVFRVSRAIFDDPALFDLEMARIFEGGWVFLGIADQAPAPHDFFTTTIGRVPVLVSRDASGNARRLRQQLHAQGLAARPDPVRQCPPACLPLSQLDL